MMQPRTAIFDLDGTLVDSARDLMGTLNFILAREGLPALPVERAQSLLGAGARALLERGFAECGQTVEPARMDVLYRDFLDYYGEHLADETVAFDGVEEALQTLKSRGWLLGICTNKVTEHSVRLIEALKLTPYFSAICGRDAFAWFKPDPRHLTLSIEAAGGDPTHAVMVGDSKTDIDTALRAGLPSVCVDFGYTDIPATQLGATHVISHFDQLISAIDAITGLTAQPALSK
ncbi:phosphoglycolate phosphatase [Labrys sp. LIt4]|uniref:Phosphoglycolate phosphatase n=1 Tax=Labrys okinawensis TaxID=346911 RepID=A0A2S9QFS1_9HYPH|nr:MULTISPECIES: HAD family hydrolase [Labrys]MBP0578414.1 phosphoglycolate phosphatase [Labrys sp. LIt4]PRH88198.1 phosphoglycolate phosphatase [Labrys okinawensis]